MDQPQIHLVTIMTLAGLTDGLLPTSVNPILVVGGILTFFFKATFFLIGSVIALVAVLCLYIAILLPLHILLHGLPDHFKEHTPPSIDPLEYMDDLSDQYVSSVSKTLFPER